MADDLETKSASAFIAFLKTSPVLKGCRFTQNEDESPKSNGTIIVTASREDEVSPPSGIYRVSVSVEFLLRMRKAGDSESLFKGKCGAIAERLEVHWLILADKLTATRGDWHCYYARIMGTDVTPKENAHRRLFTCEIEAMPISFAQAKLRQSIP